MYLPEPIYKIAPAVYIATGAITLYLSKGNPLAAFSGILLAVAGMLVVRLRADQPPVRKYNKTRR